MFKISRTPQPYADLLASMLYNQDTFYEQFVRDVQRCTQEVMIESPFITTRRLSILLPTFRKLRGRGVSIIINTRPPHEHEDEFMRREAEQAVNLLHDLDVGILLTGGHHRKLAILDRRILFEGSLNILSQSQSCEIMRRIDSQALAEQMIVFTKLNKFI